MFSRKKRRIERLLVVEDEPLVAFDTEHFLADEGYEVVATLDRVADARALIEGGTPLHLVLVDISLADGSGMDVARAAQERNVPVLFVTGHLPDEAMALANGCLAKPYAQRDLIGAIAAIDSALDGRPPKRLPAGLRLFARA